METEENRSLNKSHKITKQYYDEEEKETIFDCVDSARKFLKSHNLHFFNVIFVIIDCMCIASLLVITDIKGNFEELNKLNTNVNKCNSTMEKEHTRLTAHVILQTFENILKLTSLTILGLFTFEVISKILLIPRVIFSSVWEVLDSFVIIMSFGLNVFMTLSRIRNAAGLLVLLRLLKLIQLGSLKLQRGSVKLEILNGRKFVYIYHI